MRNLTANFGKSLDICKISSKNLVNEHQKSQRNDYPTIYQFYQKQTDWKNQICAGLIPPTGTYYTFNANTGLLTCVSLLRHL